MDNQSFASYRISSAGHLSETGEPKEVASKPTQLFSFLDQRDWKEASTSLRKNPHQATIWVQHLLPLHAAIAFGAPLHFIEELVAIYPLALRKPDQEGKLPLHYAAIFSNGDQKDIMSFMLKQYPESLWIRAKSGRTAIEFARNDELRTTERIRMRKGVECNFRL